MGLILNKVNKPFSNTSIYVPLSYNELKISDPFSSYRSVQLHAYLNGIDNVSGSRPICFRLFRVSVLSMKFC